MNRKDKNKIFIVMYALGFLIICASFTYLGNYVNKIWIGVIFLLAQQAYILPILNKRYSEMHQVESDPWLRFVPLFNETTIFTPILSKVTLGLGILIGVLGVVVLIPLSGMGWLTDIIVNIFGQSAGMNYVFYCIVFMLVSYVIINFVRGLAFAEIKRSVDNSHADYFTNRRGGAGAIFEGLQYLMFFTPIGRTISLMYVVDRLNKMMVLNDMEDLRDVNFVEEGQHGYERSI